MIDSIVFGIVRDIVSGIVRPIQLLTDYSFAFDSLLTDLPLTLSNLSATYTRSGTKYNLQNSLFVSYGANAFGTSYDASEASYGYLAEPAATNILTYSNDVSNAAWTKNEVTRAADTDTCFSFDSNKITPSTNNARHWIRHSTLVASGVLTRLQIIAKADGYRYLAIGANNGTATAANAVFDLTDGDVQQQGDNYTNATIEAIGSGWYKCSASVNSTGAQVRQPLLLVLSNTPTFPNNNNNSSFAGDGTSGILIANIQYETGSVATSPIITAGSTGTRSADVLTVPTANMTRFVDTQYSLIGDYRLAGLPSGSYTIANITDATTLNVSNIARTATNAQGVSVSGGVTQASLTIASTQLTRVKTGFSSILNAFRFSHDGTGATPDTSCIMPVDIDSLQIAHIESDPMNGYLYSLTVKTTAIDQTALDSATA